MNSSTKPFKILPFQPTFDKPKKKKLFSVLKKIFKRQEVSLEKPNKDHACYVLITCSNPSKDGNMDVEMTYEGNEDLVAYLVENASQFLQKN